ncbi:NUDIX hydrolase [Streptomonospora salina]|uniref:8-oxo-dGTP pyrophosphatase MutT (NUDIX family) n=1 Tax=Streptomonospora salina TaxID=104205 RepID=A0A841E7B0_9ACTN|nr:NUDIX hydrolase [Streptomonospora salina]MBB5998896.1 8-oxo-dGTP pyrophosphatase MutT (NUDIX family) [Streptomonospora salina]
MSDGDGWVTLPDGSRRWGRFGSAGLLLLAPEGREAGGSHVLMQHRAVWSHQGGTWGVPGGARNSDETPVQAALREFGEEVAGDPGGMELVGLHRQEHTVWRYDTVLARAVSGERLEAANWESDEVRWVGVGDVPGLRLLPAFGTTWPLLREALGERLAVDVDASTVLPAGADEDGASVERLRDDLAGLAASGVAAGALPDGIVGAGLHRWFPRIRLFVSAGAQVPEPVPGVEVVCTRPEGAPDPPVEAEPADGVRTGVLFVTGRGDAAGGRGVHTVGPSWLAAAGALPVAARRGPVAPET